MVMKKAVYFPNTSELRSQFMYFIQVLIILLPSFFISTRTQAQNVYSTNAEYKADVKIYVVDASYKADLLVYKQDREYKAEGNKGLWFFTDAAHKADKLVYFVDASYKADIKIYFTDRAYKAGWQKPALIHTMY